MVSVMAQAGPPPAQVISFAGGWQARIFTSWAFPDAILAAWDELARGYGDLGVFLESGWLEQSWSALEPGGGRLWVAVVEHAGKVVGVFPCWIRPDGGLRALIYETHFDFLVAADRRDQVLDRFLDVLHQAGLFGGAFFEGFPVSSAVVPALERRLRSRGMVRSKGGLVGRYSRPFAPFIDLRATTLEQYTAALHSKLKRNLRQGGKRAQREGEVSFEVLRQPPALDVLLAELFEVEYRSWKGDQGSAIQCDPVATRFYSAMARWAAARGCLYVFCLRLDGRLIAFDLCVAGGRTMFAFKTGYDQTFAAKLSPGNQMRYRVIEYLFTSGQFDCYDFLGPFYPWKLEWTSQSNTTTSLEFYSPGIAGWYAYFRRYGWKAPLKRSRRLAELARKFRRNSAAAPAGVSHAGEGQGHEGLSPT